MLKRNEKIRKVILIILITLFTLISMFFILLKSYQIKLRDFPMILSEKIEEVQNNIETSREKKAQEEQDKRGYTYNAYCTSGNATITGPVRKQGNQLVVPISYIDIDFKIHYTTLPAGTSHVGSGIKITIRIDKIPK